MRFLLSAVIGLMTFFAVAATPGWDDAASDPVAPEKLLWQEDFSAGKMP